MAKGKVYLVCCDKADFPEDMKVAWYIKNHDRFIIRMSSRIYHEMLKIKDEKQLDTNSYRWATRRVDDILNDKDQIWMGVGTLHYIVKCGTVL